MFKKLLMGSSVVAMGLGLTACGDDAEDTVKNINQGSGIVGTSWVKPDACEDTPMREVVTDIASEKVIIEFGGNDFTRKVQMFDSPDCGNEMKAEVVYEGEYRADEEAIEGRPGALNIELKAAKIQIKDETMARALSAIDYCGVDEYEVNKFYEVKDDNAEGACLVDNVPLNLYGAYEIDDDKLIVDSEISDMSKDEEGRDTDLKVEYVRQ